MVVKSCAQSLYETQKLHMISWWGDLTLMDNFQTPLGELPENLWKLSAHGKSPYKETMQFSHTLCTVNDCKNILHPLLEANMWNIVFAMKQTCGT